MIKITLPALALSYFFGIITLTQVLIGMVLTYFLILIGFVLYLNLLGQFNLKPNFSFLNKERIKEIRTYSIYGILSGAGSVLALRIDLIMVASIVDLDRAGIYTIAVFIAGVIAVPYRALANIGSSIISKAWSENDISAIEVIYKKSSLILLIIGGLLFLFIWMNLDEFFSIMPNGEKYISGKNVVLLLGFAKLIDIAASLNDHIINYSKYFRFNFYAILLLAVLNLINNYLLIPEYKMMGAAAATLISFTVFNIVKLVYIYLRIKIQPFSRNTIYVLLIGILSYVILWLVPSTGNSILNMLISGVVLVIVFLGPIMYFKLSVDLNDLFYKMWSRVLRIF